MNRLNVQGGRRETFTQRQKFFLMTISSSDDHVHGIAVAVNHGDPFHRLGRVIFWIRATHRYQYAIQASVPATQREGPMSGELRPNEGEGRAEQSRRLFGNQT